MNLSPTAGFGVTFVNEDVRAINKTGGSVSAGDCVLFDLAQSSATDNIYGTETGGFSTVVATDATYANFGIHGIALEDAAANVVFKVRVRGRVDVNIESDGTGASGARVAILDDAENLSAGGGATNKALGLLLQIPSGTPLTAEILFDGISGFGLA